MRQLVINGTTVDAVVRSKTIDAPKVKTNMVAIEGANGSLDLSTVLTEGNPIYENRELSFDLALIGADFFDAQDTWNNLYHGKVVQITTSDQTGTYYAGRCSLSDWKEERGYIAFTLTVDAEPFRYEAAETIVTVSASSGSGTAITLVNGRKWVSPTITPSAALQLVIGTKTYGLQAGAQIVPDIIIKDTGLTLKVVGTGTCQFKYRKGWL